MNAPIYEDKGRFNPAPAEMLDFGGVLQILRRRWLAIFGAMFLCLAGALLITVSMTKQYTATTLVLIENRENRIVDIESVLSGLPADSATIDSQVEILQSQALAGRVVAQLGLVEDPEFNASLREAEAGPVSWKDPASWLRLIPSTGGGSTEMSGDQAFATVVEDVQERTYIRRRGLTYVIEVGFRSESPEKAARIANAIADLYIVDQLEARYDATRRANDWLSERLQSLREQVREAETAAATFAADNNLISTGDSTVTEQQLSEITQQLTSARAERTAAEASFNRVQRVVDSGGDIQSITQIVNSPAIQELRAQQTSLRREEAELSSRYLDDHPDLIQARQQMQQVEDQIDREVQRILSSLENEVEVARDRERSLQSALDDVTSEQAENNQAMIRYRELDRNAQAQRTLYEDFLSRFNETRQQEDLQTSDARVIAEATPPLNASHPRTALNLALGGVFGVFLGFGAVFLIELTDQGLRTRDELESYLGFPQIAAIPLLNNRDMTNKRKRLIPSDLVVTKPASTYASAIQALRVSLDLSNVDQRPKVVLVTSALPGEGKTTTALSLARLAARSGQRTFLIDADLRHPALQKLILPREKRPQDGLVNVLAGESSIEDVVFKDELADELIMMFAGKPAENPTDMLKSNRMSQLIESLKTHSDFIVIDAPPVLPVVDSRILAQMADTTTFVLRWHETPRGAARDALRLLMDSRANVAGIALSQVDINRQRSYGYSGEYKYYGKYKGYYSD